MDDDHRITAAGRAERTRGDTPPGPHAAGPGISTPAGRIVALDSLRGLAAFAVVIYHCLMVFPGPAVTLAGNGTPFHAPDGGGLRVLLLTASPPSLFWSGREAVLLFFVLSGFVLALPFSRGGRPPTCPSRPSASAGWSCPARRWSCRSRRWCRCWPQPTARS